jgi:hypothetical protein
MISAALPVEDNRRMKQAKGSGGLKKSYVMRDACKEYRML